MIAARPTSPGAVIVAAMADEQARVPGIEVERGALCDWWYLRLGKANAVGERFLVALETALDGAALPSSGPARPIVITGEGSAFSAGLELPALLDLDRAALAEFLRRFHRAFLRFACLPRPTIAAINGHAVAGGAVLALACDWRIGARTLPGSDKPPLLGVNEVALGLPFPRSAGAIVAHGLGGPARAAGPMLTGELVDPENALRRGLLHAVVSADELRAAAEARASAFAAGSAAAVAHTKGTLRRDLAALLPAEDGDDHFLDAWFSADTQARLRAVVARLRR